MTSTIRHKRRWVSIIVALTWGFVCCAVQAETWPTVRAIDFAGNDVTRPSVMLREIVVRVGGEADPALIARSRQAILDLGLFNGVSVNEVAVPGGVALTFVVIEKWYVLPLPRLEMNPNGDYGYGGQLRWNNVWGLNHTLNVQVVRRHYQDPDKQGQFAWQGTYAVPFIDGSPYGLTVSGGHTLQDSMNLDGSHYGESFDDASVMLSRSLSKPPRSQGWSIGVGLAWQRENTSGALAPPPQGKALALVTSVSYNGMQSQVYGEHGVRFSAGYSRNVHGLFSDYSASVYTASFVRTWQIGTVAYQNLRLLTNLGLYTGGPPGNTPQAFALGGGRQMRGYSSNFVEGNFSYYLGSEFLRPVGWKWLRALAFAEAGSVHPRFGHTDGRPLYADVGIGLRLRIVWLVNIDVQAGIAVPLIADGSGRRWRAFAGSGT